MVVVLEYYEIEQNHDVERISSYFRVPLMRLILCHLFRDFTIAPLTIVAHVRWRKSESLSKKCVIIGHYS